MDVEIDIDIDVDADIDLSVDFFLQHGCPFSGPFKKKRQTGLGSPLTKQVLMAIQGMWDLFASRPTARKGHGCFRLIEDRRSRP